MPGMRVHPPTHTQHEKKSSGLHPGIKGGGQQSDKSGPLQIKFDENAPLFSQNRFSVNAVWVGALVLAEGWGGKQPRKVITVFMTRMLFLTLDSLPSRKPYWRYFSLVSISAGWREEIGFVSLMNTMNHTCLLPWASARQCQTWGCPAKGAGFNPRPIPSPPSRTAFDFLCLMILSSFVTMNRFLLAYSK